MTDIESMTLRCSSRLDLLTLPVALFGHVPSESLVLIRMHDNLVECAARLDLEALLTSHDAVFKEIRSIAGETKAPSDGWLLLAYSQIPDRYATAIDASLFRLAGVRGVFVTDGRRTWELLDGQLVDEEPVTSAGSLLRLGTAVEHTGGEDSPLPAWNPQPSWTDAARELVWAQSPEEQLELLRCLLEAGEPRGRDKAVLASLLGEEECFAECLAQLRCSVAPARRRTLLAAREEAPPEAVANVTALLALAYWLEGNDAMTSACLSELSSADPGHPLGRTVEMMQRLGLPPSRWDES